MNAIHAALPACVDVPYVLRTVGKILFIMAVGGFGGFIFGISKLLDGGRTGSKTEGVWKASCGVPVHQYLWGQAAVGCGGALAAVFGMLTIGNATRAGSANDVTDLPISIYLAALCVVGGFVGNRLLSQTAEDLLRQLKRTEKKVEENADKLLETESKLLETKAKVSETETKVHQLMDANQELTLEQSSLKEQIREFERVQRDINKTRRLVDELEKYRTNMNGGLRSRAMELLEKLKAYKQKLATERFFVIVFANLNFELGLHEEFVQLRDEAFALWENFLDLRRKAKVAEDEDDEVAWYNMSCYNVVLGVFNPDEAALWNERAVKTLKESLRIAQAIGFEQLRGRVAWIEEDEEMASVKDTDLFRTLLKPFKTAAGGQISSGV